MSAHTHFSFVNDEKPFPKELNCLEKIGLESVFTPSALFPPERMWEGAKRVYGEVTDMPEELPIIIWGREVVDAQSTEECPQCGWAGDIFILCPYHLDRLCTDCGGINGTVASCRCP